MTMLPKTFLGFQFMLICLHELAFPYLLSLIIDALQLAYWAAYKLAF